MKTIVLFTAFFLGTASYGHSPAVEQEPAIEIHLSAQLWKRGLSPSDQLNFEMIGKPRAIVVPLIDTREGRLRRLAITETEEGHEIRADITFVLSPKTPSRPSYVVTQVRLYRDSTLFAECSNYDSIANENAPGVGACSGVTNALQYGVSLAVPARPSL